MSDTSPPTPPSTPPLPAAPAGQLLSLRGGSAPFADDCPRVNHNWDDFPLQLQHANCCRTPLELELLGEVHRKVDDFVGSSYSSYWAKLKHTQHYDSTASIITRSSYAGREDFIRCGYCSFSCGDRLLCPRCCSRHLAQPLLHEFGNAFSSDREVFFIVVSLSTNPDHTHRLILKNLDASDLHNIRSRSLVQPCSPEDFGIEFSAPDHLVQCRLLFSFMTDAIREFTGDGRGKFFSGAVGGPELAVRFYPLRVLPHSNHLVWTPNFSPDMARELRGRIRTRMRDCRPLPGGLYPTLACYRLATPDDLRLVAQYMVKPIALATAYLAAADLVRYEPVDMIELNRQTNDFLLHLPLLFYGLKRISRFWRCNAVHHDYFGTDTPWRIEQRRRDAERRRLYGHYDVTIGQNDSLRRGVKQTPLERWEKIARLRFGRQAPPRPTRFSYWQERNDTRPPSPPFSRPN